VAVPGKRRGSGKAVPLSLKSGGAGAVVVEGKLHSGVVGLGGSPNAWGSQVHEAGEFASGIPPHAVDEFQPVLLICGGVSGLEGCWLEEKDAGTQHGATYPGTGAKECAKRSGELWEPEGSGRHSSKIHRRMEIINIIIIKEGRLRLGLAKA
jgi:hypothetical protein